MEDNEVEGMAQPSGVIYQEGQTHTAEHFNQNARRGYQESDSGNISWLDDRDNGTTRSEGGEFEGSRGLRDDGRP